MNLEYKFKIGDIVNRKPDIQRAWTSYEEEENLIITEFWTDPLNYNWPRIIFRCESLEDKVDGMVWVYHYRENELKLSKLTIRNNKLNELGI